MSALRAWWAYCSAGGRPEHGFWKGTGRLILMYLTIGVVAVLLGAMYYAVKVWLT